MTAFIITVLFNLYWIVRWPEMVKGCATFKSPFGFCLFWWLYNLFGVFALFSWKYSTRHGP